jgi:hypothetical protein
MYPDRVTNLFKLDEGLGELASVVVVVSGYAWKGGSVAVTAAEVHAVTK